MPFAGKELVWVPAFEASATIQLSVDEIWLEFFEDRLLKPEPGHYDSS